MPVDPTPEQLLLARLNAHLIGLYPDDDPAPLSERIVEELGFPHGVQEPPEQRNIWSEDDVLTITYGDSIVREGEAPLKTLDAFLSEWLAGVVTGVHVLPFFPYSSDDGFSVVDYHAVNPELGAWEDVASISEKFNVMADLVVNHVSSQSEWFENFLADRAPGKGYFIEIDPEADLSAVVRPRATPLAQEFETAAGKKLVWCTFSRDQVDLNYQNPEVLLEIVRVVKRYLDSGVKTLRLDAVGFLWKEVGTPCMHLPQTHEFVRMVRTLIERRDPEAMIITETNVPNRENLTYFGNGNEAHAIYNFSLAPLMLHTLTTGDCTHLKSWMMSMPPAQYGTAYLNFLASHDGIGLRPAEGLLNQQELDDLVATMRAFGARVNMRTGADGLQKPYELNVTFWDALQGRTGGEPDGFQLVRFLCATTIMLALDGIPAIYIHTFLSSPNDEEKFKRTGENRSLNRRNWDYDELMSDLRSPRSARGRVFAEICRLVRIRRKQGAFHPNATQYTLHFGPNVFGFWRQSIKREQSIFAIHNVSHERQVLSLGGINLTLNDHWRDLISGKDIVDRQGILELEPYQCVWLTNKF